MCAKPHSPRSKLMAKIRSKNTKIELAVFRELRKRGVYYVPHYDKVPGKPDIAKPRKKKAVFIDGDFWHGYKFTSLKKRLPKGYWLEKIQKNILRDRKNRRYLAKNGWSVLRIWEHELKSNFDSCICKIISFLNS